MKTRLRSSTWQDAFDVVKALGGAYPDVRAATKYDGSPVLKVGGCFMAELAMHHSAEPGTLVVRVHLEERQWLLDDAPAAYYLTDYYRRHPIVLVRLARVDRDALRDLLSVSRRLTLTNHLREQPPVDQRCHEVRMRLALDQDSVVDQVVACQQSARLNDELPAIAEKPQQLSMALAVIDNQLMHRLDDDGIVMRRGSSRCVLATAVRADRRWTDFCGCSPRLAPVCNGLRPLPIE